MDTGWAAALDDLVRRALGQPEPPPELIAACLDRARSADPADFDTVVHCCDRMARLAGHLSHGDEPAAVDGPVRAAAEATLTAFASTGSPVLPMGFARQLSRHGMSEHGIDVLDRALAVADRAPSDESPSATARLHRLRGELLRRLGYLDAAESSLVTALAALDDRDVDALRLRGAVLNDLGLTRQGRHDLTGAADALIEALEIGERVGEEPLSLAVTLDNLGVVQAALATASGPVTTADGYVNLTSAQHLRDAEEFLRRAGEIFEAALPDAAEDLVISLVNRADAAAKAGEVQCQDELSRRAVELLETYPVTRATAMSTLSMRGQALERQGRYRDVVDLLAPALPDWMDAGAPDRPLEGFAALLSAAHHDGDQELAAAVGMCIAATDAELSARRMAGAAEAAARTMMAEVMRRTETVLGYCLPAAAAGEAPDWLYELLLNRKGVLAERQGSGWLRARADAGAPLERVRALRAEVARTDLEWTGEEMIAAARRRQRQAARRLGDAEVELYRHLGGHWVATLTVGEVRDHLPEHTALLDIATVRRPSGEREYLVFRVTGRDAIRYRRLGVVHEIDERLNQLGRFAAERPTPDRDLDWTARVRALMPALVDAADPLPRALVIAPSGRWGMVSPAFLRDSAGVPLAERHVLTLIPSARWLVARRSAPDPPPVGPPIVLGAPDFDHQVDAAEPLIFAMRVSSLPHARAEIEEVARRFGVTPVVGAAATRSRLLAAVRPRILHIATHGVFLDAIGHAAERDEPTGYRVRAIAGVAVRTENTELADDRIERAQTVRTRHRSRVRWLLRIGPAAQLSRSALLLAGFNAWLAGARTTPEVSAGIVSAGELALLDLAGTELVVLSACETGVGAVDFADGSLLGLRTAALAAGARCCLSTLWQVDDASAAALVSAFYAELATGSTPAEALRSAQLTVRRTRPEPYHWAGWVVEGG
ncbi:CHAT domain [Nocardia otitidiscaviarum]|uniref:CHAT domain n=1 Tax=Nocardia otitidiscaviarum TaxID=1823 RepID=A0A379JH45_9NOCA|nr:CHAT domain-containing protein [Nocardia otitidiscaviarum]SUD47969.1 CHAT domain [Nocardia otitidiscaviarum]